MRLTRDDERARRICSLALEFMNAQVPVASSAIAREFYPGLSADSFRRAFSRDRQALAACGMVVEERPSGRGESLWVVDETRFAQGAELEPVEAAALDVACQPLLDDPAFPLATDLRLALAKLTRAFAEVAAVTTPGRREPRPAAQLRSCLVEGHAARVGYTDAHGTHSQRVIAPYGTFELRGESYLVAGRLAEDGSLVEGGERTYRMDRFDSVEELPHVPVSVPADFSLDDWRRLPFQLGPTVSTACFEVPPSREADLRRAAGAWGSFAKKDGALVWSVPVSDEAAAASWAIAQGIRPLSPDGVVAHWKALLEGVARRAS